MKLWAGPAALGSRRRDLYTHYPHHSYRPSCFRAGQGQGQGRCTAGWFPVASSELLFSVTKGEVRFLVTDGDVTQNQFFSHLAAFPSLSHYTGNQNISIYRYLINGL